MVHFLSVYFRHYEEEEFDAAIFVDLIEAYLCKGSPQWVYELSEDYPKIKGMIILSRLIVCETRVMSQEDEDKSIKALREILGSMKPDRPATVQCIERTIWANFYSLLCGDQRQLYFPMAVNYIIYGLKKSPEAIDTSNLKTLIKICEYALKFQTAIFAMIDPICPSAHGSAALHKRQFGVKDLMHTFQNLFCDEELLVLLDEEYSRRYGEEYEEPFMKVAIKMLEGWACCYVTDIIQDMHAWVAL